MTKAFTAKFNQDRYAQQYLKDTGDYVLAEASTNKIWGIGKRLNDKNIAQKDTWTGQNLLGTILMKIRDNLCIHYLKICELYADILYCAIATWL